MGPLTKGMFPNAFAGYEGALPPWLVGAVICGVVLTYIFAGGSRAAAWANTFQTLVFMCMGVLAFYLISQKLGGLAEAIKQANPAHLVRTPSELEIVGKGGAFTREVGVPPLDVPELHVYSLKCGDVSPPVSALVDGQECADVQADGGGASDLYSYCVGPVRVDGFMGDGSICCEPK